ncbi:hypothetical protein APHAL10511_001207 [Amanita phalloides]|nr:hypothetical protein APHAL10511_001207 [Amanita phalloides]
MPKRAAPLSSGPAKKRKVSVASKRRSTPSRKNQEKVTTHNVFDDDNDDKMELSDQDYNFLEEFGDSTSFLRHLDHKGMARNKHKLEKTLRLNKGNVQISTQDALPSNSDASSDIDHQPLSVTLESQSSDSDYSNAEMPYERGPRKTRSSESPSGRRVIERLPIKLADGRLLKTGMKGLPSSQYIAKDVEQQDIQVTPICKVEDISTAARLGHSSVLDVISETSRKRRIEHAKDQIASICQEIIADPEKSLGWLKRLYTFSMKEISSPHHPKPVPNDPIIRKLAILSQLAIFKDIVPDYRIRQLTEKEASEKVSQMVARLRDWEQGLVAAYQNYLRCLEAELKAQSDLSETALKCMCALLTDLTHFNFRVNLMACIIGQLSRRSWTETSEMCLNCLNSVFRADVTGVASLEIVRILNRMIKERRLQVNPNVLSCLLNLRLKSELNIRASDSRADNADRPGTLRREKGTRGRAKGKKSGQHVSRNARKALKERREVEKEFQEAEAVIDKEEQAARQTETLKLLFSLYFRILKNPTPNSLLPTALHGISKFAHLVNVDFFKDLMTVLKNLISPDSHEDDVALSGSSAIERLRLRLLCIVTAFGLLSEQGEALNIDPSDFITRLYGLILPLSLILDNDSPCISNSGDNNGRRHQRLKMADLLFEALAFVFSPRTFGTAAPSWRSAAFAKRLLTASLNWSPILILRTLDFVGNLISKDPKLEALLSTEDRIHDGIYRPEIDDPQLCHSFGACFWELQGFQNHWDARVREKSWKILHSKHVA